MKRIILFVSFVVFAVVLSGCKSTYEKASATAPAVADPTQAHWARLETLDAVFRREGWQSWLTAAGVRWDSVVAEARQIEEETNPATGKISAAGLQVNATNLIVNWPNIVTTDVKSRISVSAETVQYQPDARNGSVLYTNVVVNGPVTVWIDGQNWGQFTSQLGFVSMTTIEVVETPQLVPTATAVPTALPTATCLSLSELAQLGEVIQELEYPSGVLAGAQIRFTRDWEVPSGWVVQLEGAEVTEVTSGQVASVWSPEACRPLGR